MEKNQQNQNKRELFAYFCFYSLFLIVFDIVFLIYFKPININVFMVLLMDIGIGLLISFLMSLGGKWYKIFMFALIDFIIIFYVAFELIEIVTDNIVGNVFNFSTFIFTVKLAIQEYGGEIFEMIKNRIVLILLVSAVGLLFIYITKKIYLENKLVFTRKKSLSILAASIITFLICSLLTNHNVYDFESDMHANGLKMAIIHDVFKNNKLQILKAQKSDDEKDANAKDEKLKDKEYYYDTSKYNVINIDFDELMLNEEREDYNAINEYIKDRKPTEKNEYTGIFKGKNLIMICAEAWNGSFVDEELYPAMYRLIHKGFKFNNFYQPHGASSTSSGEYSFMTGMIPVNNDRTFVNSINNNMGFTISMKLHNLNYQTYSFHNGRSVYYGRDETHDSLMGFERYIANDTGLNEMTDQFYTDDYNMLKVAYDMVKKDKPFLEYFMTYTGHKPYVGELSGKMLDYYNIIDRKYKDQYTVPVKYYMAKNMYLEKGLEYILEKLEEDNLINDTVICMVPDHYPYGFINVNEIAGDDIDYLYDLYKNEEIHSNKSYRDKTDIILWSGSLENEYKSLAKPVDKVACTIDLTPTLLNLFGIEFDSRLYPGRDIFSKEKGRAVYQTGMYVNSELQNKYVSAMINQESDEEVFEVNNLLNYCRFNVKNDYYGYLVNERGNKQKTCYLTFDGGPTDNTGKILRILNDKNVKATFFITGENEKSLLPYIVNQGHTLGVQSYSKEYDRIYGSDEAFIEDFNKIYEIAASVNVGSKVQFMRFYGGSGNTISLLTNPGGMTRATDMIYAKGLSFVDWNVDSGDINNISKDEIVANVLAGTEINDDICVRLHDESDSYNTVEALPEIIDRLREKGYRFKRFNEFTRLFHQEILN